MTAPGYGANPREEATRRARDTPSAYEQLTDPDIWPDQETTSMIGHYGERCPKCGELTRNCKCPKPGPYTVTLTDVKPERVEWLWPKWLPLGKLVVLDGNPDIGKSTLAIDFAARVSTGSPWPDGAPCTSGDVLILSAEDGLHDTIRPRLDAAGGDPARVRAFTEIRYADEDGKLRARLPTLADIGDLEALIIEHPVRFVIVDVLMAYLPGRIDSHRDQDVRSILAPLAGLAERHRCCILLLRHPPKSPSVNPVFAGGGSIGISGAARAGLLAHTDPEDETRSVLAPAMSNLARKPSALGYRIVNDELRDCGRIQWLGEVRHTAADLLASHDDGEQTELRAMDDWLRDLLADGPVRATGVYREADAAGYSKDQLKRAKRRLGRAVIARKDGMDGPWFWALAEHADRIEGSAKGAKGAGAESPHPSPSSAHSSGPDRCGDCELPDGQHRPNCPRRDEPGDNLDGIF